MKSMFRLSAVGRPAAVCAAAVMCAAVARAWDYPGHRMINQIAMAALPPDFPAWARTGPGADRIAYLAGEPDRWRDTKLAPLEHYNGMDHYIDLEQLPEAGIALDTLTPFRYDFCIEFAKGRAAHADRFPPIDVRKDWDHSRAWPGFLPWTMYEYYAKIQVEFSILRTLERHGGTPDEIENTKASLIYMMGVMGHYVGDGSQPLHTTIYHHGWVGPNPHGYTTDYRFHEWIDGGFIRKAGIKLGELLPQSHIVRPFSVAPTAKERYPVFADIVQYLERQNREVEPLYRLEKEGKLQGPGPESAEGRAFIDGQLVKGGEMLARLWLTAWRNPTPCGYLQRELMAHATPAP
ncbi:MAG: hypothetical protein ACREFX_13745 [Opitutaceae bacterium]